MKCTNIMYNEMYKHCVQCTNITYSEMYKHYVQ